MTPRMDQAELHETLISGQGRGVQGSEARSAGQGTATVICVLCLHSGFSYRQGGVRIVDASVKILTRRCQI